MTRGRPASRRAQHAAVFSVLAIDSLTTGLFVPLSLLYLVRSSAQPLAVVGLLLSVAGVATLPLPLWFGRFVDRAGAKRAVLIAQVLQALGAAVYLVAGTPLLVFVGAVTSSAGQRVFSSTSLVLATEMSDRHDRPRARERWFALVAALRAAGYGVGALVAGLSLTARSQELWRALLLVDVALLVMAAVIVVTSIPRRPGHASDAAGGGYGRLLGDRRYLALIGLNAGFALCNLMLGIAFPPFVADSVPNLTWLVGPLLLLNTVVQAAAQAGVGRLVRNLPRRVALSLAGGLWLTWSALTGLLLAVPPEARPPVVIAAVVSYSFAQMVHGPVSNAIAADAAPAEMRGRYLAAFQYSFGVAGVIAPLFFSALTSLGRPVPWIVLGVIAALTIPGSLLLGRALPAGFDGRR